MLKITTRLFAVMLFLSCIQPVWAQESEDGAVAFESDPVLAGTTDEDPKITSAQELIAQCRDRMVNDRATLYCVEQALEQTEEDYAAASAQEQQETARIDDVPEKREAVRALASSALAFENYREAECLRQKNRVTDEFEAYLLYLACKTELFRARIAELQL